MGPRSYRTYFGNQAVHQLLQKPPSLLTSNQMYLMMVLQLKQQPSLLKLYQVYLMTVIQLRQQQSLVELYQMYLMMVIQLRQQSLSSPKSYQK